MLAVIQWEKCGDMRIKRKRERRVQTGVLPAPRWRVWYVGAGVVSGAGFCSINKRARPNAQMRGVMQLKATVYARKGWSNQEDGDMTTPTYAARMVLAGWGEAVVAFMGAISVTGCQPVTSGVRCCGSADRGTDPLRAK